ncbi:valine--tRNA ligase [candidate division WWE3 bacterium]|nr:valine--tRNA ligase [candidate division WWE3 bacterium]
MDKTYNHKNSENEIYAYWESLDLFSPEKSYKAREKAELENKNDTFSVLMPPPNANAPLHCGHATYAIQDIMARIKRMQGFKTLYLPGTDHAGFETQVVYERKLKEQGKSRFDFDRDTLYEKVLNFVKENSQMATDQLKKLGMSADWERLTFMLDDHVIDTVYNTFEKMHEDGLVYRDTYMVNYSTFHGTTFSNLETTHKESVSPLYYVKYALKDSEEIITVATVRPETIYADVAIAVNPDDSRYGKMVGKVAINPLNGKELEIIEDSYVDPEFGTGALKITPGHDFNDYEIGQKHNLPIITVIDLEGKMTKDAVDVSGMYPKPARKKVAEILEDKGALVKVDEKYKHSLLADYKDKREIEPLPLPNWFIKMEGLAEEAKKVIKKEEVKFNRPLWKKEILRWLNEIYDWPISRQIVFGIKIPVWYDIEKNPDLHVTFIDQKGVSHDGKIENLLKNHDLADIKEGLQKLIAPIGAEYEVSRNPPGEKYIQETDTFDTWFSSGQWPLTTLKYPNNKDFKEFFPTDFMDSMWDILFFWIARMIMFSLYLTDQIPFKNVYIHGAITDEKGKKMSKSKGNVINPMEFIEEYGADALRMGLVVGGNTAAKQTALSEDKVRGYRNFANKIWNMARFMELMKEDFGEKVPLYNPENYKLALQKEDKDLLKELEKTVTKVNEELEKYRFADAGNEVYHFMWHTLADEYIETVKDRKDKKVALSVLDHAYKTCLKLLHPFMPFATEKIWQEITEDEVPLMISQWPKV